MNCRRKVVLEDGSVYFGTGFGADSEKIVELVFNTSMVGYQEILSDPSYTYQAVVMTYPLIGNYGMCDEDYETRVPSMSGLIVHEYCDEPSNFRTSATLAEIMKKYDIVGVSGIDTRQLARHIRTFGSMKALITFEDTDTKEAVARLKVSQIPTDAVAKVSTKEQYRVGAAWDHEHLHVVAIDCGMKENIVREMVKRELSVTVVPWDTNAEEIKALHPDGVFISNGPGDPSDAVSYTHLRAHET